jgi:hypothetical protein
MNPYIVHAKLSLSVDVQLLDEQIKVLSYLLYDDKVSLTEEQFDALDGVINLLDEIWTQVTP